jgi:hypothetical protein
MKQKTYLLSERSGFLDTEVTPKQVKVEGDAEGENAELFKAKIGLINPIVKPRFEGNGIVDHRPFRGNWDSPERRYR